MELGATSRSGGRSRPAAQAGAALLIVLALVGVVTGLALLWIAGSAASEAQRVQDTATTMGLIRDALVARAATDFNRPGSLPCPDTNNDGSADGGGMCAAPYLGRLPWKTLDLPDLRDASGERFWYALSPAFRDHTSLPALNSDTAADLTINGAASQENVAIIFAPGEPLAGQDRNPGTPANLITAANYLEGNNVPSSGSDRDYQAGDATATFNDRALVLTRDMLMPEVERRVARQARNCLENFALNAGGGHYPYAAPLWQWPSLNEDSGALSGRIPSSPALGAWPDDVPDPGGGTACFAGGTWWDSWRELLLYRVSEAYAPYGASDCGMDPCLTVNSQGNVQFVVIVAGRTLPGPAQSPGQARAGFFNKMWSANYLEAAPGGSNVTGFSSGNFQRRPLAATTGPSGRFNDRVECVGAAICD